MKKIVALCLAVFLLLSCAAAFADSAPAEMTDLLSQLKIMNGDPDGNFRFADSVTRAEFTKIAVAASQYKDSVATNLAISPFPDVPYTHWAAPYVKVGVTNGLVTGYPDGSFRPDDQVTYEEAITMLLKVLGYTDEDFGNAWPYGQIGLADNLELSDGAEGTVGMPINRGQAAVLVYNTLNTRQKDGQQDLLSIFDTQLVEDVTLISTNLQDAALGADELYTSAGTYKIDDSFDRSNVGCKGDLYIKNDTQVIAFVADDAQEGYQTYVVYSVVGSTVMCSVDGQIQQLEIPQGATVYRDRTATTFAAVQSELEMGDILYVHKNGNEIDYLSYQDGALDGPVTVQSDSWQSAFAVNEQTTVTRDGYQSTLAQIQIYDIVYFSEALNQVMAYSNKITGIYESASPNRDAPTSVTVSGTEYEIEGASAFSKLAAGGTYSYGDTVTLLLGNKNQVADVITPGAQQGDGEVVGYVLGVGSKEVTASDTTRYTSNYIQVVLPDGSVYEYVTDRNYEDYVNSVMEITFTDGLARLQSVSDQSTVSGTYQHSTRRLGSTKVADNVKILDVGVLDVNKTSIYTTVFPQRLDGVNINAKDVLYASANASGEIDTMILKDVTGDAYQYGIMTRVQTNSSASMIGNLSGTYEYIVDGVSYSYTTSGSIYGVSAGQAFKLAPSPSRPETVQGLTEVKTNGRLLSSRSYRAGDTTYKVSDDVTIYLRTTGTSTTYTVLPVSEALASGDTYRMTAYYDKSAESGGCIRVIVATRNVTS